MSLKNKNIMTHVISPTIRYVLCFKDSSQFQGFFAQIITSKNQQFEQKDEQTS